MQLHDQTPHPDLPVVVIGAGPVGLAAAARLVEEDIPFLVLEAGDRAGASIARWAHVRLFSPWRYLVDDAARSLLSDTGWRSPEDDGIPTGGALLQSYLEPLAAHPSIAPFVRTGARVKTVTRAGLDKLSDGDRAERPFAVHTEHADGRDEVILARAVVDASGTYENPSPLGTSGVPARGESENADRIFYGIPDVRGVDRARFAGARVGVVGSGHSAFNALLDLSRLTGAERPHVSWFIRSETGPALFGGEDDDELSERGALGKRMRLLAESGDLSVHTNFRTAAMHAEGDGPAAGAVILESDDGVRSAPLDVVIVVTGFRPDLSITRELRVALDPAVEAPVALAPLIDPNLHSCGTVPPHGFRELSHPDEGYYTVGMKSYGRAPTFLLLTGYEQVRSVVKAIAGDLEAAERVELVLPETGVCSTDAVSGGASSCCSAPAPAAIDPPADECCGPTESGDPCCAPTSDPVPLSIGPAKL